MSAASRRFAERGYAHVTLQEIAADAGVTPALVNRYFVSKRALFELVVQTRGTGFVEEPSPVDVFARSIVDYWRDADARAPALALVRSIDLDDGDLLRRELESRIREPLRALLHDDPEAEAKMRLLESLIMGFGLFGTGVLLGEADSGFPPEVVAAVEHRLTRMIEACLND